MSINQLLVSKQDIENQQSIEIKKGEYVDYKDKVCVKPWGHEFLIFENDKVAIWCLCIRKGQSTSLHCHFGKDSIISVLSGCLKLQTLEQNYALTSMETINIPRFKFHALGSYASETWIIEMEVFYDVPYTDKNDLLRIVDPYQRKIKTYEGSVTVVEPENRHHFFKLKKGEDIQVQKTFVKLDNKPSGSLCFLLRGIFLLNGVYMREGSVFFSKPGLIISNEVNLFLCVTKHDYILDQKIIYGIEHLEMEKQKWKDQKVVLTSGCYDIMHVGHLTNLSSSKQLGDLLVVCLSNDEQVKALKGPERPVNKYNDRIDMVKTLPYVDKVVLYDEENIATEKTLDAIMKLIDPAIWAKGDDYKEEAIRLKHPSLKQIILLPNIPDKSTTLLVKSLQNLPSKRRIVLTNPYSFGDQLIFLQFVKLLIENNPDLDIIWNPRKRYSFSNISWVKEKGEYDSKNCFIIGTSYSDYLNKNPDDYSLEGTNRVMKIVVKKLNDEGFPVFYPEIKDLTSLLPVLPEVNIEYFFKWKNDQKKVIFYYNWLPCSYQRLPFENHIAHERFIECLSQKLPEYSILIPEFNSDKRWPNVYSCRDLWNIQREPDASNIIVIEKISSNCDVSIIQNIGASMFYFNAFNYHYPTNVKRIHMCLKNGDNGRYVKQINAYNRKLSEPVIVEDEQDAFQKVPIIIEDALKN